MKIAVNPPDGARLRHSRDPADTMTAAAPPDRGAAERLFAALTHFSSPECRSASRAFAPGRLGSLLMDRHMMLQFGRSRPQSFCRRARASQSSGSRTHTRVPTPIRLSMVTSPPCRRPALTMDSPNLCRCGGARTGRAPGSMARRRARIFVADATPLSSIGRRCFRSARADRDLAAAVGERMALESRFQQYLTERAFVGNDVRKFADDRLLELHARFARRRCQNFAATRHHLRRERFGRDLEIVGLIFDMSRCR